MKLIDGTRLMLQEEEFKNLEGKSGLIFIRSLGQVVNLSSVSRIAPSTVFGKDEDRSKQVFGVLHDGSRAIRQFGRWYDMDGPMNEQGNYIVSFDPAHYPEVGKDMVPTVEEWQQEYAALLPSERLAKVHAQTGTKLLSSGDPKHIKEIIFSRDEKEKLLFSASKWIPALEENPRTEKELLKLSPNCPHPILKKWLRKQEQEGRLENAGGLWQVGS